MLYRLTEENSKFKGLESVEFQGLHGAGGLEKDLENILSEHLFDVIFEDGTLMPIHQERKRQPEGDIYAVNRNGDLVIFELKLHSAGAEAMHQILRYAQDAGQWSYGQLESKFKAYYPDEGKDVFLSEFHRDAFNLDRQLLPAEFNRNQHLYVVGNAADDELINAVDYWKHRGLSVTFLPYRIFDIAGKRYFEFFSHPYDRHQNPSAVKGVLFDTNRSFNENSIWEMMEKKRASAYGGVKDVVQRLNIKDIVFFCHKQMGIVAAGEVKGPVKSDGPDERYRDVKFLTPVPVHGQEINYMPLSKVSEVLDKSFYLARTIKVPYLTKAESDVLIKELKEWISD